MNPGKRNYRRDNGRGNAFRNNRISHMRDLIDASIRNFILGTPTEDRNRTSGRKWGTSHHWVQQQRFDIDGIKGIGLVDSFDLFDQPFSRLSSEEIASAAINKKGLLITTENYIKSPLITNLITDQISLDRFRQDLHTMFDLVIALSLDSEGYFVRGEVLPACRASDWTMYDIDRNNRSVIHTVGHQAGLYRVCRAGIRLADPRTKIFGQFTQEDDKGVSLLAKQIAEAFLNDTYASGLKWGIRSPETQKEFDSYERLIQQAQEDAAIAALETAVTV